MTADEARRGLAVLLQERLRVEALLVAGIEALAADKLPEALDAARAALKEEPDNAKALELEKAALHLQRSEPSAAALAAQKEPFLGWLADLRRTARLEEQGPKALVAPRRPVNTFGDAAVDVDSLSDHELVQQRLRALRGAA